MKPNDTNKTTRGRPSSYKNEYSELVTNYTILGATDSQLAEFFEVSETTLNTWKKKHPEFKQALQKGKTLADSDVAKALYDRAIGYISKETRIATHEGKITDIVKVDKHIQSDVQACIFWLRNRQPELWREKQFIEHSSESSIGDIIDSIQDS